MTTVTNRFGKEIEWNVAVDLMDDCLREFMHYAQEHYDKYFECSREQDFFDRYCTEHYMRFGKRWVLDSPNPTY